MRRFSISATLLLVAFLAASVPAQDRMPNVIVILADDQGWGDLSLHDNPNLSTPNIDQIARDGAHIENFYVCAVCSPTRAEFLTGRYHNRMGVYSTSAGGERFDASERTIAQVFQDAGYGTACYGKWHSGMQYPYHPNARGFDLFYGFCSGHWGNYWDPMLERNGVITKGSGFIVDDLTEQAIDFMKASEDKPFFIYLALNTPHSPMQVPEPFWNRFKDKEIVADPEPANAKKEKELHTRAALAMVENIDANVGHLINYLDTSKLADDTIVVYFSDNGPNGSRFNGGMRGRKGSTFEGGLRSPCVVRYPRKIQAGSVVKQVGGAIDLLPTLGDLAGVDWKSGVKPEQPLDGVSLAKDLTNPGTNDSNQKRRLFSTWRGKLTVRTQKYRMHGDGQLFDIESDRREKNNIAAQKPDVAKQLQSELNQWKASWEGQDAQTPRPFTLGHPDAEWTQLPSRDAILHGSVKRSNRFPNCTYVMNWADTESEITWDVDVLAGGKHEVQMYYACPKSDLGATIELSLGDQRISTKIDQAVEGPMIGSPRDYVPRQEGDVRRWKPMTLGTIDLESGPGTLRLKATDVPGKQVAEMRMLMFRKL